MSYTEYLGAVGQTSMRSVGTSFVSLFSGRDCTHARGRDFHNGEDQRATGSCSASFSLPFDPNIYQL